MRDERVIRHPPREAAVKLGRVCTTIAGETGEEMSRKATTAFALGSDLVEFRFDLADEEPEEAAKETELFFRKAVVTVRERGEGGGFRGTEEERLSAIDRLAKLRPMYLDVELKTVKENGAWYARLPKGPKKIVSWHDLTGTPSIRKMRAARREAGEAGDIAKIVTLAKRRQDNLRVLRLYEEDSRSLIAFCMGDAGSASRLASLRLGSPLIYAALPNEVVAPGQLSVATVVGLKREWEGRR